MKGKPKRCISPEDSNVPNDVLQLNGRDIPLVHNVSNLGVTFDRWMTLRHHIERTVAKDFRTYVRTYSLFKSGCLSTNIKLTLYKALSRLVMTYARPTLEYAADARLFQLQRLQNRILRAIGNLDRCTQVCELHMAFKITYVHDYITKLCRTRVEVILYHVNPNVRGIGQEEARHRTYKRLKFGGGQAYDRSAN
jgi:hypothetical protein